MAVNSLRSETTPELAELSGGDSFSFTDRHDLEQHLASITNHLANRYLLSFRPSPNQPSFHTLQLTVPQHPAAAITARSAYWVPGVIPADPAPAR